MIVRLVLFFTILAGGLSALWYWATRGSRLSSKESELAQVQLESKELAYDAEILDVKAKNEERRKQLFKDED